MIQCIAGVKLKQEDIHAYRLLLEYNDIQQIADTLQRGLAIQRWGDKATAFVKLNQSYLVPALILVGEEPRQPQQNCDDVNQQA